MKKLYRGIVLTIVFFAVFVMILNVRLTTSQCVNYHCRQVPIPLYLKTLDFFDRHLNYRRLAESIAARKLSEKERVRLLLAWTVEHIKSNPPGFPVVDDHAWHIIVRGYGVDDQFQDVFTTLCNYAGMEAFFTAVPAADKSGRKSLSFVRVDRSWRVFDAYRGVYLKGPGDDFASLKEITAGKFTAKAVSGEIPDFDYGKSLRVSGIKESARDWEFSRAAIQSPLRRFYFWVKKRK